MSQASELQKKIRTTIPLSEAMQFSIAELSKYSIFVQAPLSPNVNIHGTGFAGSLYSLAVLSGWAMVTHIINSQQLNADLVVGRAEIRYNKPVEDDIECRCTVTRESYDAFVNDLKSRGRAKLTLDTIVGESQAVLTGTFFASMK